MAKSKQRNRDRRQTVFVAGGIVIIAILVVLVLIRVSSPTGLTSTEDLGPDPSIPRGLTSDGLHFLGDPDAPLTVLEYEDFGCPNCKSSFIEVEPLLIRDYIATGKVRLVIYTVAFVNLQSLPGAEAALCAAEQGYFWEYRQVAFLNQGRMAFNRDNFSLMADVVGLDTAEFLACYDSAQFRESILERTEAAQQFGLSGTPTFVIAGQSYPGLRPFTSDNPEVPGLKEIIDQALAAVGLND